MISTTSLHNDNVDLLSRTHEIFGACFNTRNVLLVVFGVLATQLLDVSILLPLFGLCADCCGCDNSSDGGGGGGGGGPSTPFFCTWNGKKFQLENDVLFGKPGSMFQTAEEGRAAYENGYIAGDLYRIQNPISLKDGKLAFQIKEIEPEESYFDHISLTRVVYPQQSGLYVRSDFSGFEVFKTDAINKKEGVESQKINGVGMQEEQQNMLLDSTMTQTDRQQPQKEFIMESDEYIRISGSVTDRSNPLYLFLSARYHDWSAGYIPELETMRTQSDGILSPFRDISIGSFRGVLRASFLVVLLVGMWAISNVVNRSSHEVSGMRNDAGGVSNADELTLLAAAFKTPRASADHRSFKISYWNGNSFQKVDVIEPRYYQQSTNIVAIPQEAIQKDGVVTIEVRATKRHAVASAFLAAPREHLKHDTKTLSVTKAVSDRTQSDYAKVLNKKMSGKYLQTLPGDVVDIEFQIPEAKTDNSLQESYLLHTDGYYAVASEETLRCAGDWISKLDPDTRSWLEEMYSMRGQQEASEVSIVS